MTNPANYLQHMPAPAKQLTLTAAPWTATAPPGYPNFAACPAGGFYPDPKHIGGPHPVVQASCGSAGAATQTANQAGKGDPKAVIEVCQAVLQ